MLFQPNFDNNAIFRKFFRIELYIFGVIAILIWIVSIYGVIITSESYGIRELRINYIVMLCVDAVNVFILFSWALLRGYFATVVRFTEYSFRLRVLISELFIYFTGVFLSSSIGPFSAELGTAFLFSFFSIGLFPLAIIFSSCALSDFFLFKTLREKAKQLDENSTERKKEHAYRTPLMIMGGYFLLCLIGILYLPIYVNP